MNDLDARIVALLKRNARMSVTQMSLELGVSRVTIDAHIKKMEASGVITGYSARLDPEAVGHGLCVLVHLSLRRHTLDSTAEIEREVSSYPEVLQCFAVTGNADYVLRVVVPDMASYDRFLNEKIFTLKAIAQVNSNFALREIKNSHTLPLA